MLIIKSLNSLHIKSIKEFYNTLYSIKIGIYFEMDLDIDTLVNYHLLKLYRPYWFAFAVHVIFVTFVACLFFYSFVCFIRGEFSWQCCN